MERAGTRRDPPGPAGRPGGRSSSGTVISARGPVDPLHALLNTLSV